MKAAPSGAEGINVIRQSAAELETGETRAARFTAKRGEAAAHHNGRKARGVLPGA